MDKQEEMSMTTMATTTKKRVTVEMIYKAMIDAMQKIKNGLHAGRYNKDDWFVIFARTLLDGTLTIEHGRFDDDTYDLFKEGVPGSGYGCFMVALQLNEFDLLNGYDVVLTAACVRVCDRWEIE